MGFFNPANLLYALSLGLLVLIYLRARSRPTLDVSSLMLFEEVPAPIARSRVLRIDPVFWLELLALAALTLAAAGFYIYRPAPLATHRSHALVFDLGAAMGARNGRATRLGEARDAALAILAQAAPGEEFSVIGYALEAVTIRAHTGNKVEVRNALAALRPAAVAPRPGALRAALIAARGADSIELFSDRPPPGGIIEDARPQGRVGFHRVGASADNLAIVALDPGRPRGAQGRCLVRNFSLHPRQCELAIDAGAGEIFHSTLMLEPRAQMSVPFGPLPAGGLIHARILTPDALAADNERYALAPSIAQAHALVMSPDADVRDDLARIVLAVNPNFIVSAVDPARFAGSATAAQHFDFAVLHDCADTAVNAAAKLFIFPEPWLDRAKAPPLVPVSGTAALAELVSRDDAGPLASPVMLGPARVIVMPAWMDALAAGITVGASDSFVLAAEGHNAGGEVGAIAFDIRKHLLLDPDRMDALVLVIDTMKRLVAPPGIEIVPTGSAVAVTTFAAAALLAPGGSTRELLPDETGRVRIRPLEAGRYHLTSANRNVEIFANYYDAAQSDLAAPPPTATATAVIAQPELVNVAMRAAPAALALTGFALLLLLAESLVLARRAVYWGARHV